MPRVKKYEGKIPAYYRRSALDLMLFTHVTALCERNDMTLEQGIEDFFDMWGISTEEYPLESAKVTYNRVRNNFIWSELKDKDKDTI